MYSSELPIQLEDAEEAKWLIALDKENNWIESFKNNLSWFARWDLFFYKYRSLYITWIKISVKNREYY